MFDKKNLKLISISIIAVLSLVVVLQNTESVETKILFVSFTMPRVVLLLTMLAIGFVLGLTLAGRIRKKREHADEA